MIEPTQAEREAAKQREIEQFEAEKRAEIERKKAEKLREKV